MEPVLITVVVSPPLAQELRGLSKPYGADKELELEVPNTLRADRWHYTAIVSAGENGTTTQVVTQATSRLPSPHQKMQAHAFREAEHSLENSEAKHALIVDKAALLKEHGYSCHLVTALFLGQNGYVDTHLDCCGTLLLLPSTKSGSSSGQEGTEHCNF